MSTQLESLEHTAGYTEKEQLGSESERDAMSMQGHPGSPQHTGQEADTEANTEAFSLMVSKNASWVRTYSLVIRLWFNRSSLP